MLSSEHPSYVEPEQLYLSLSLPVDLRLSLEETMRLRL